MASKTQRKSEGAGQALVEFALIILIVAFLIFAIIEGSRILQANLTAQNAARAAARYAITGQYDASCLMDSPPCAEPRVESIKSVARQELGGLPLDDGAAYGEPSYYLIEVEGIDESGNWVADYAGIPGGAIMVRVTYRVGLVTPLVRPIAKSVRVVGQVIMNNERFTQVSRTSGADDGPPPPPPPPPPPDPPDLQVKKEASVATALVGVPFDYSINVVNLSRTVAENVWLEDTLPDGYDFAYIGSPSHGNACSPSGSPPTIRCNLGDIPGNGGTTVTLRVQADSPGEDVTNIAIAEYPGDANPADNDGSVTIDIIAPPSNTTVDISKGASAPVVAVGGELLYSISVVNTGAVDAEGVQVTDVVPAGMTVTSVTAVPDDECSFNGNSVECNFNSIPPAPNGSETVTIRVTAITEGTYTNRADVAADNADPDSDTAQVEVVNVADLGVTKSASPNPGAGEEMTYTISVVNNGPANTSDVSVVDSLPPSVAFVSALPSQGSCGQAGNVVTCSLGAINDGAGATINVVVVPPQAGSITNSVSVTGGPGDPDDPYALNDNFTLETIVQARSDLSITKTGPQQAVAGETIRYDVTVENLGPSAAEGVFLTDTLPPNVTFVAAATAGSSQGTCSGSNSAVTCALGTIPSGGVVNIDIWIIPRRGGSITNSATVTSSTTDPDDSNNTDSTDTTVDGSQPYIYLEPVCGPAGTTVTVYGYNWQNSSPYQGIDIYFNEVLVGTVPRPGGNTTSWTYALTIPAGTADGDYLVEANQRRGGNQQGIWADATITVPCPAPNLIISRPQLVSGTPVVVGQPVVFTANVSNIGNLDAVSQFFAGLYFDPAPAPTASSTHITASYRKAIVALNGLAAGASKTVTFTVDAGFSTAGTHLVYGVADSDPAPTGVISAEHIETDNISPSRQVSVSAAPTATPTATATAGATATPTPTPAPTAQPGGLIVSVNTEEGQPQANAQISVIDEDSGAVVATGYSDINGTHFFQNLPPATYTVTTCIVIENVDYYAFATGIVVQSGAVSQRILFLQPAPGGCI